MKEKDNPENTNFINPIDPDKITETPHILPYAHTVGGVEIKPIDKGKVKGRAVSSMYEQTDMQLNQIRKQIELLAQQAQSIQNRVLISERIYQADMNFEPLVSFVYHLYRKSDSKYVVSMVAPDEWGTHSPYTFVATVTLLADHTWDIIEEGDMNAL